MYSHIYNPFTKKA